MHELRYFQEIICIGDDLDDLFLEKCGYIVNQTYRYPEGLKIYFEGKNEWIFDFLPTKKQASDFLSRSLLPPLHVLK